MFIRIILLRKQWPFKVIFSNTYRRERRIYWLKAKKWCQSRTLSDSCKKVLKMYFAIIQLFNYSTIQISLIWTGKLQSWPSMVLLKVLLFLWIKQKFPYKTVRDIGCFDRKISHFKTERINSSNLKVTYHSYEPYKITSIDWNYKWTYLFWNEISYRFRKGRIFTHQRHI